MEGMVLQKDALTETYKDTEKLINKVTWNFYETYGGDFEEWKAQANLIFIKTYHSYEKSKGGFSTWLYIHIWKKLLDYATTLYKQSPNIIMNTNDENMVESKTKHNFSSLELLDGIQEDTNTLIHLIWNPTEELKNMKIKNGNHPCHIKVILRSYLSKLGWTAKRVRESFEEITRIIND